MLDRCRSIPRCANSTIEALRRLPDKHASTVAARRYHWHQAHGSRHSVLKALRAVIVESGCVWGQEEATGEDYNVEAAEEGPRPFTALLDTGLKRTSTGSKVFAALKVRTRSSPAPMHQCSRLPI